MGEKDCRQQEQLIIVLEVRSPMLFFFMFQRLTYDDYNSCFLIYLTSFLWQKECQEYEIGSIIGGSLV